MHVNSSYGWPCVHVLWLTLTWCAYTTQLLLKYVHNDMHTTQHMHSDMILLNGFHNSFHNTPMRVHSTLPFRPGVWTITPYTTLQADTRPEGKWKVWWSIHQAWREVESVVHEYICMCVYRGLCYWFILCIHDGSSVFVCILVCLLLRASLTGILIMSTHRWWHHHHVLHTIAPPMAERRLLEHCKL